MTLERFCQIKLERARDLRGQGKLAEAERELAEALNFDQAKPYYVDGEKPNAKVVSITKPNKE